MITLTIGISQEDYDLVQNQLRPEEVRGVNGGTIDIPAETVEGWLKGALKGKIYTCKKRNEPEAILREEKKELEIRLSEIQERDPTP